VFLPVTYIYSQDPQATVIILPSDHFVFPERLFIEQVNTARDLANRFDDRLILIGATPDQAQDEYGWIEPGVRPDSEACGDKKRLQNVLSFQEKPTSKNAADFFNRGYLWNTMVMVVKVKTLWRLGQQLLPEMMERFDLLLRVLQAIQARGVNKDQERIAVSHIYAQLQSLNFSRGLLERATEQTLVFPMDQIHWSDWGSPSRIVESLDRIGESPSFPLRCMGVLNRRLNIRPRHETVRVR
jgi:mannose-1-phosphate guanylyltransferase